MKNHVATVTVRFAAEPGGMQGSVEDWAAHVRKGLEEFKYNEHSHAPMRYCDFDIASVILDPS